MELSHLPVDYVKYRSTALHTPLRNQSCPKVNIPEIDSFQQNSKGASLTTMAALGRRLRYYQQ